MREAKPHPPDPRLSRSRATLLRHHNLNEAQVRLPGEMGHDAGSPGFTLKTCYYAKRSLRYFIWNRDIDTRPPINSICSMRWTRPPMHRECGDDESRPAVCCSCLEKQQRIRHKGTKSATSSACALKLMYRQVPCSGQIQDSGVERHDCSTTNSVCREGVKLGLSGLIAPA